MNHFKSSDWLDKEGRYWTTFFNTISGPRSAVLIGTQDENKIGNLGIFNSLVHIGAKPPLLGFILRPTSVPRDTYENILKTGNYTINHITSQLVEQAHKSSAKYASDVDEFNAIGLSKKFIQDCHAPFIKESPIKLGLKLVEEHIIKANGTRLIVGEVKHVLIDNELVNPDGYIDTTAAQTMLTSGLDAYHSHQLQTRLPYAKT